jgi:hypothetical protein
VPTGIPAIVHWYEIGCAPAEQLAVSVMSVLGDAGFCWLVLFPLIEQPLGGPVVVSTVPLQARVLVLESNVNVWPLGQSGTVSLI